MKVLIAPNALKGSLDTQAAANAIKAGMQQVMPNANYQLLPVADGGDGLLQVLDRVLSSKAPVSHIECEVEGPCGKPLVASYLYQAQGKLAVIEMASAAGLALLKPSELDPMHASTAGVGQLLVDALDRGAETIILGIGGSATNDAGLGMMRVLGGRFLNAQGESLRGDACSLLSLASYDLSQLDARLKSVTLDVVCDVNNPLLGPDGAARVYGPQKGADAAQVAQLERGFENFAQLVKQNTGLDVGNLPGAGAAGGMGAGLQALLGANLRTGTDVIFEFLEFEQALAGADLVVTAEGRLDAQTRFGKAPAAVAARAGDAGIPCVVIAGAIEPGLEPGDLGFNAAYTLVDAHTGVEQAMAHADELMQKAAKQLAEDYCSVAWFP